jgi:hypothetical protein
MDWAVVQMAQPAPLDQSFRASVDSSFRPVSGLALRKGRQKVYGKSETAHRALLKLAPCGSSAASRPTRSLAPSCRARRRSPSAFGPEAGLRLVDEIGDAAALRHYAPLPAARGDFLFRAGRLAEARSEFKAAATLTRNVRESAFLLARADACDGQR